VGSNDSLSDLPSYFYHGGGICEVIKRKQPKQALQQDVEAVHRYGCGCLLVVLFGIMLSMIIAALMEQ